MATIKNLLFNLKDEKNIDIIQILKSFVYDDRELRIYSEGKRYKYRDIVIHFDEDVNRFMTYRCKVDTSSANWNESEWQKESALNTMNVIEDKLIINANTQPTDIENKLWFKNVTDFNNGKKAVEVMIKNEDKEYEKLYPSGIVENIYMNQTETKTLKDKLNKDDIDIDRIRSNYIIDIFNAMEDIEIFTSEKTTEYSKVIKASECNVTGQHIKNKSIIII